VEWVIVLNFDSQKFARKYALRYTAILAIFLIVPLIIYVMLLLQIDEAKVKLSLERETRELILSMQHYDNSEEIYHFPRHKEYQAGLYGMRFDTIFTTLSSTPKSFLEGFHKERDRYYLITPLPNDYFFGAKYIILSTHHTAYNIYFVATVVLMSIVMILFFVSLLLLRSFSTPFERLNTQLDTFIKDSMHEINTPLTIINLNADLSINKYGENIYLWRIKSASKTLATIYNDMDYLVKRGRVEYKREPIDMGEFISNRVKYFQEVANLKNIDLLTDIADEVYYKFSKTKLQRVIDNTLSNAIKYSGDSSKVEIGLLQDSKNILFYVKDYGVGIEDIDKIFSRYYRENRNKGGFGIGLNIVKEIIDEEGVELEVSSKVGEGSKFCYRFMIY
jgi:signal transduction histidine kinase